MHVRLFVTFNKEHAETSEEARDYVTSQLLDDGLFIGEGGRFHTPVCDWFVIGGRWSGELTRRLLPQETLKQVDNEFGKTYGWYTGGKKGITVEQRRREYQSVFSMYFPDFKGELPAWRNDYQEMGYDDDAMLATEALYTACLRTYEGSYEAMDEDILVFSDLDFDDVTSSFIGKKWVVVVDYHM